MVPANPRTRERGDRQTIDLGVIQATAETRERMPDWVGFGALAAGVVLLLAGGGRRD